MRVDVSLNELDCPALRPASKVAHLIRQLPRAKHHIVEYARMIATDTGSWERSVVHQRMCDNLGLDYSTFRPFESAEITKIPSQKEAEDIIYNAIGDVLRKHMFT